MRYLSILFAVSLIFALGCGSAMTLHQREIATRDRYSSIDELLKEHPTIAHLRALATNPALLNDVAARKEHASNQTVAFGVLGKLSGLTGTAGGFGFGLAMDIANWNSKENKLARLQENDIRVRHVMPALIAYKVTVADINEAFKQTEQKILTKISNLGGDCRIFGYSDSMKYAYAHAYNVPGKLIYRHYTCFTSPKTRYWGVIILAASNGNSIEIAVSLEDTVKLDSEAAWSSENTTRAPYWTYGLKEIYDDMFIGWTRIYGGFSEPYDYKWKMKLITSDGEELFVDSLRLPDKDKQEKIDELHSSISNLIKKNNGNIQDVMEQVKSSL